MGQGASSQGPSGTAGGAAGGTAGSASSGATGGAGQSGSDPPASSTPTLDALHSPGLLEDSAAARTLRDRLEPLARQNAWHSCVMNVLGALGAFALLLGFVAMLAMVGQNTRRSVSAEAAARDVPRQVREDITRLHDQSMADRRELRLQLDDRLDQLEADMRALLLAVPPRRVKPAAVGRRRPSRDSPPRGGP